MSLQSPGTIYSFAGRMYRAWCVWDNVLPYAVTHNFPQPPGTPPGIPIPAPQMIALRRKQLMVRAIRNATAFMPNLNVVAYPQPAGQTGEFDYQTWSLRVDPNLWNNMNLAFPDFVELCCTLYHEARHAEQFYRIAQGLACGRLQFRRGGPTAAQLGNMHANPGATGGGVQARIALFNRLHNVNNQVITPGYLAQRSFLPLHVATAAMQNAIAEFDAYLQVARPTWFRKATILAEVNEWYSAFYTTYHNHFTHYDQPQEHDAHSIETPVRNAMRALIGVQPRVAGAGRTRADNDFNHLPTA